MPIKFIRKIGGSYYILLPKQKVEFFGWDRSVAIIDEFTSDKIVIKKLDVKVEPKLRVGVNNDRSKSS